MIYIFIVFILISLYGIKKSDGNYLSKEQTTAIKGFFTIIILFSHFNGYIELSNNTINNIYLKIFSLIGQFMVTMFLFYSGYGILKSIENKKDYIKTFPKKRILKVIIKFYCALLLFIIINYFLNNYYSLHDTLLSFTGWTSIGNSNWFVFVIIMLYLITYLVFKIFNKKSNIFNIHLISILSIFLIIILYFTKESWWYNIILCYPLGLYYACYEKQINNILARKYWIILCGILLFFIGLYFISSNIIAYEIEACLFSFLVVLFTYKIRLINKNLLFIGKYSFEIYILQRLSYMILKGHIISIPIYFIISVIITILISIFFYKVTELICNKLILRKD